MNNIIIDKNNLLYNCDIVKKCAPNAKICAVVKANAYGHGMKNISQILKDSVDYFAVSTIKEGIELRKDGIRNNILILGYILPEQVKSTIDYNLEICIGNKEQLNVYISIAKLLNKKIKFHLKKNSGLSRYGYDTNSEFLDLLNIIDNNLQFLHFVGFFTHFTITDEECEKNIEQQSKLFEKDISIINNRGYKPIIHAASSTTLFLTKKYQYDMVRIGMALYGFCGFNENLKHVLSVQSSVVYTRDIDKNQAIGYGNITKYNSNKKIAVVPIGYGYGLSSKLSQGANVLICGDQCPIVGNMSMDCMYVDITHLSNETKIGSEVIFIGKQKNIEISATDHAKILKVYSCEILSQLNTNRFNIIIKS